jgi:cobyrinic acid a,c-diamide synthase
LFEDALFRGNEFHYATIETAIEGDPPFAFVPDAHGGAEQAEGNRRGKVTGSFFHVIAADAS